LALPWNANKASKDPDRLAASAFRGLEGIDFPLSGAVRCFAQVGGHIAAPASPLNGWIGEYEAVSARGEFFGFLATMALVDDRMTAPAVELAALLVHEEAIYTRFNRCTNHGYHVLSFWDVKKKKRVLCLNFFGVST
jgi:hypothetical protein